MPVYHAPLNARALLQVAHGGPFAPRAAAAAAAEAHGAPGGLGVRQQAPNVLRLSYIKNLGKVASIAKSLPMWHRDVAVLGCIGCNEVA